MKTNFNLICLTLLFSLSSWAQMKPDNNQVYAQEAQVLEVDLEDMCNEGIHSQSLNFKQENFCNTLKNIPTEQIRQMKPIEVKLQDQDSEPWIIRFHYGFSRTYYNPTDLHIKSTPVTATIKDVKMIERTSSHYYNPGSWDNIGDALKWIDEPTNTFNLSFEKKGNVLYLTVFHPKYLKSLQYTTKEVNGEEVLVFEDMVHTTDFSTPKPQGYNELYLGNTHKNMSWQVGYGRSFKLIKNKKYGELSLIPKVEVGIASGSARSVRIVPGIAWDDYIDKNRIQGFNTSGGLRAEYKLGRISAHAEYRTTYSKLSHSFYDGEINYDLSYQNFTFGLGIDILKLKNKKRNN